MVKEDHTTGKMRTSRGKIFAATLLLALILISCVKGILFSDTVRMEDEQWSMYDPAKFACIVEDTTGSYNLTFTVRTSSDYPYRNLYMFVITTFPSGLSVSDTLQGVLSNEKGEWLGKGAGDTRELIIPYKSNVFFPEEGEYHFKVIQGMRDTILYGIYDFGMTIAKQAK